MERVQRIFEGSELEKFMQGVLHSKGASGRLLFGCVAGSHAYNLNSETSDCDYIGVYLSEIHNYLAIKVCLRA